MSAVIFGAGTYGEVYLHYLRDVGVDVIGFLDDDSAKQERKIAGVPVIGGSADLSRVCQAGAKELYSPVGDALFRSRVNRLARGLGLVTPNFVHRSVVLDSPIPVDAGILVLPGSVIMPSVEIQSDVMISIGVKVAHHSTLEEGVFLAGGVSVGAGMRLGHHSYVGANATLVSGKCGTIGARAMIGAGSVVVSDVPSDAVFAGVPATMMRSRQ